MQFNYLKYWRVVRYWIKAKYGLTTGELDMLLLAALASVADGHVCDFKPQDEGEL